MTNSIIFLILELHDKNNLSFEINTWREILKYKKIIYE